MIVKIPPEDKEKLKSIKTKVSAAWVLARSGKEYKLDLTLPEFTLLLSLVGHLSD